MNNSKHRHDGGAYRRTETMITYHAKDGKDRTKAKKRKPKKQDRRQPWRKFTAPTKPQEERSDQP